MSVPPHMMDWPAQYKIGLTSDEAGNHFVKDNHGYDLGQSRDLDIINDSVNTVNGEFEATGKRRPYRELIGMFQ
jgi:hypothetical protein